MVRTVKVRLELDRDDYKRGLRDAAGEMRGFDGEVRTLGKDVHATGIEVKAAGTQVEAMGREVDTAAKKTTSLGDETEKTKRKTTGLGDETDKTKTKIVDLAKEITTTKTALAALGEEFQKTGQVNITELDRLSRSLRDLERAKAAIGKLVPAGDRDRERPNRGLVDFALDEWAGRVSKATVDGISGGLPAIGRLGPAMTTSLAVGAVAAAPAIGAAINAGVLLGVGGGALAGGIVLAARDARVKDAWAEVGRGAMDQLNSAAGVFVQPLVRAAQTLGTAFDSVMPAIRRDFAALAPLVDRLAAGVAGFVTKSMPGVSDSLRAAGPILRQLATDLPMLGSAMSSFLSSVARGGEGARLFFHDLMTLVSGTIAYLGQVVELLSKAYELSHKIPGFGGFIQLMGDLTNKSKDGKDALDGVAEGADGVVPPLEAAGDATARLVGSFRDAIREVGFFTETLDKVNGGNIALATSQIGAESALYRFKDALKESNGSLDIHTEKGRTAKQAAIDLALAAGEVAQKTYEQSGSSSQGAVALEGYRQALYNAARQSGMTEQAAHALVEQFLAFPKEASTPVKAPGLAQTKADAAEAFRNLDALDGKVVNTYAYNHVVTRYSSEGERHAQQRGFIDVFAKGGIRTAAVGLIIPPSNPGTVLTAEPQTGGEVLIPMRGIDTARAAMLAQTAVGGYGLDVVPRAPGYAAFANSRPMGSGGGSTTYISIPINAGMGTDGYRVGQQIAEALRPFVQRNGGDVQMAIVGRQVS